MDSVARLAVAAFVVALLSGCVLNPGSDGASPSTAPAGQAHDVGTAATPADAIGPVTNDGQTNATPSEVPAFAACRAGADMTALAVLRVHDATGQPQSNIAVQAMHEWSAYDAKRTDAFGCVIFGFDGPGEYQFATAGGECERQGTATMEWDGLQDVNIDLAVDSVCNQA